jgi:hypothetical protein
MLCSGIVQFAKDVVIGDRIRRIRARIVAVVPGAVEVMSSRGQSAIRFGVATPRGKPQIIQQGSAVIGFEIRGVTVGLALGHEPWHVCHYLVEAMILVDDKHNVLRYRHLSKSCQAGEHQHRGNGHKPRHFLEKHNAPFLRNNSPPCWDECTKALKELEFSFGLSGILLPAYPLSMTASLKIDEIMCTK